MIKYLWKIIFILGVYNFSAPPTPGYNWLSFLWSSGMLQAYARDRGYHEGALVRVHFLSLSWLRYTHKVVWVPGKTWRNALFQWSSFRTASVREGRYCTALKYTWAVLGLLASFQYRYHTHMPHTESRSPWRSPNIYSVLIWPLTSTCSLPEPTKCSAFIKVTTCPSHLSHRTARGLGLPLAHLGGSPTVIITRIRRTELNWTELKVSAKSFKGQTFISCSSWSCRRLRSSSSSSSRPLDLRLASAPSSTANITSHVSPREGGLGLQGLGHLCSTCQVSKVSSGPQRSWTTQGEKKKEPATNSAPPTGFLRQGALFDKPVQCVIQ